MIIQHNIMALNAHRQLGGNNSLVSKNLEKLSSGYKINRAGDDAAGLAISEKMRAQITGLTRAQANAQDGISLVQTAEGALTEVHSMLNRMVDLTTQAANGTIKADDRQKAQDEIKALSDEIDRISSATDFNGIKLLDGSLGGAKITKTDGTTGAVGAGTAAVAAVYDGGTETVMAADGNLVIGGHTTAITVATEATLAAQLGKFVTDYNTNATAKADWTASLNDAGDGVKFTAKTAGAFGSTGAPAAAPAGTTVVTAGADAAAGTATPTAATTKLDFVGKTGAQLLGGTMTIGTTAAGKFQFTKAGETAATGFTAIELTDADNAAAIATKVAAAVATNVAGFTAAADADGGVTLTETTPAGTTKAPEVSFAKVGLTMQVGDSNQAYNKVTVSVGDMSTAGLDVSGLSVATQDDAAASLEKVKTAINTVSENRSALGAMQNRLEHTINNLAVTTENMTAAESRIRDVDMAKEMMQFTKNNVLSQAAQAMLAQANQQPQQVLQLLR